MWSWLMRRVLYLQVAIWLLLSCSPLYPTGHHDNLVAQAPYRPQMVTPHKPPRSSQITPSLVSPFNANVLLALGQRPSPSSEEKEELFGENSLGMLSEVAQYHSELSEAEANANSSLEAPVREKLANIRLVTSSGKKWMHLQHIAWS